jgi:hypothetical protein
MLSEPILVLARLARIFDALGVRYLVGGSLASSLYGIPRATQDVDLVADLEPSHVDGLSAALSDGFYADAATIRDAVDRHESFNVVDLETMFKADIFVARGDPWSCEEMARARTERLDVPGGAVSINFASPEDTLLHKMVWYKLGNQTSERQWRDIVGVVKVQGASLEVAYLERWAPTLGVSDLLHRALMDA